MSAPFPSRWLWLALWGCWAFSSPAQGESFDELLSLDQLWSLKPEEFLRAAQSLPFEWTSNSKDSARAAGPNMTLFGLPVVEVIGRFEAGKLKEITALIYARGDVGNLSSDQFNSLIKTAVAALNKTTNSKLTVRGKDPTNAVKAEGVQWQTEKARFLLEYSFTKEMRSRGIDFRAEFIRLEITSPERTTSLLNNATVRPRFTGSLHVKRDPKTGDSFIPDVPMVDQGQKGYCVVAATERVMRYYNVSTDANELAQIANSDAAAGTSFGSMIEALKKIAARLKVRVRIVEEQDYKAVMGLIKDYNRSAKKTKTSELPDPGRFIDIGAIFRSMDYEVLKDARTHNKGDLNKFQRNVQANIDQGIPLLWCVQLGLHPEPGIPQNAGGHMRLIIGYNNSTQEILFSDSWGAGHELKRMSAADAWSITTGITVIEPL